MCNDVLILEIPQESTNVGFADDIALSLMAHHINEVELNTNSTVDN